MNDDQRTPSAAALTDLILDLFSLSGRMLVAGDRLVADLGLTSARWRVLGAVAAAASPRPVAWLARDFGGNRQNVQRIVDDMAAAGWVAFAPNPHHKRARLVVLTPEGARIFAEAMRLQAPWANRLAEGLSPEALRSAHRLILALRRKLEDEGEAEG